MRDPLCSESYLLETIEFDKEAICERKKKIIMLKDDMEKGIQRYPKDNQSIIYATYRGMFMYNTEILIAKYSLGSHPNEIIEDYLNGIEYLENVGEEKVWYIDLLWMLSLGILLEVDKQDLKRLACVIEKQKKRRRTDGFSFKGLWYRMES